MRKWRIPHDVHKVLDEMAATISGPEILDAPTVEVKLTARAKDGNIAFLGGVFPLKQAPE